MPTIKEEMAALDKRKFTWYDNLSADEQKSLSMWVLMRYAATTSSNVAEINEHYLTVVNDFVNVNFNDLRHYPDFQWRLMQLAGLGTDQIHSWLKPMKKKKDELKTSNKLYAFFETQYPFYNEDELIFMLSQMDKADILAELTAHGMSDKQAKAIMK